MTLRSSGPIRGVCVVVIVIVIRESLQFALRGNPGRYDNNDNDNDNHKDNDAKSISLIW
jgi:hypothetical protein